MTPKLPETIRRVVLKLGTGLLTSAGDGQQDRLTAIAAGIARLRSRSVEVLVVSSGAVGLGMGRLGLKKRPRQMTKVQMCAAVGQSVLIENWQRALDPHGIKVAQVLITREDVTARDRHLGLRDALETMIAEGVVPVINENDCISTEEIRFGDNDVLSALVASMSKAQLLFILSTIPGLMNMETGEVIPVVESITPEIEAMASGTLSPTAVGGMVTKIEAARIATASGCGVFIGNGRQEKLIKSLMMGEGEGTFFVPNQRSMGSRERWMAFFDRPRGALVLDDGAVRAVVEERRSLLPAGVVAIEGGFLKGDSVNLKNRNGAVVARGIVSVDSETLAEWSGKGRKELALKLETGQRPEVLHRDRMVIL